MVTTTKRVLPVKVKTIELNDAWTGWTFEARVNPPTSVFAKLQKQDFNLICEALGECVHDWNFVDEEGEPLESPGEAKALAKAAYRSENGKKKPDRAAEYGLMVEAAGEAVGRCPFDLVVAMAGALTEAVSQPEKN